MIHPTTAGSAPVAPTYQVHLNGVCPGHDGAVVAVALAPVFKRSASQVLALLNGPALVLKRGLDRRIAEHYVATLARAGCACSMHLQSAPPQVLGRLAKVAWAVPHAGPPALPSRSGPQADPGLAMAAIGQTLCIDAILLSVVFLVLYRTSILGFMLCSVAISTLSVLGVVRIARGLQFSLPMCVFNAVAAIIPLINVVFLGVSSVMVSRRVKQAGFKVGFLGVSARERARIRGAAPELPHYDRLPSIATVFALVLICINTPVSLDQGIFIVDGIQVGHSGPAPQPAPPRPMPANIAPVDQFEARDIVHIEVAEDDTIYAGADRASYRSTNGGASWERLQDRVLGDFTLTPKGQLFDLASGYVYKSTDGAHSFAKMGYATQKGEEEDSHAGSLSFAAGRLFAVSDGLIVSDDEGKSWRHLKKALNGGRVHAASDGTLYYGFHEMTSSSDGGRNWKSIPLPEGTSMTMMATSTDGQLVFAADPWYGDSFVSLWSTRDKGRTWTPIDQGLPTDSGFHVVFVTGLADGSMMAAGTNGLIYRRAAGALSWTKTSSGLPGTEECALGQKKILPGVYTIVQGQSGRVYAGTRHGVFLSRDKGISWTPSLVLRTGF